MNQLLASVILLLVLFSISGALYAKDKRAFTYNQKNALWIKSKGKCEKCKVNLVPFKGEHNSFEADHKRPYSKGGKTTLKNGQALCRRCNRRKSNK